MSSITPARTRATATSTGLPRRLLAVAVTVGCLMAAFDPASSGWPAVWAALAALAAAAVALADEDRWRRGCQVLRPGPGRGRHRADLVPATARDERPRLPQPLPRPRRHLADSPVSSR